MYKIIDSNIRRDFINIELTKGVLELPLRICKVYFSLVDRLATEAELPLKAINAAGGDLNSPEISEIAKEFWRHFPQHYLRNYRMLLETESGISNKEQTLVLDNPIVSIVDVGSGAGAFTLAHLEFLARYHEHRLSRNLPVFPVTVHVLGLDNRNFIADLFGHSIQVTTEQLAPLKIYVQGGFLDQPFEVAPILGWLEKKVVKSHMLVLGLSNVIKPFHEAHEDKLQKVRRIFSTTINHILDIWSDEFSPQAQVIHEIFQSGFVDQICIQAIASDSNHGNTSWEQLLRDFAGIVASRLGVSSSYLHNSVYRSTFDAELPENSWWHNEYKSTTAKGLKAWCASIIAQTEHYSLDSFWLEVVNYDNLMLAWSRARNEILATQWEDGLELRLFEANIEERIRKLQIDITHYLWGELMIENTLNYAVPKGAGQEPRPMSLGRIQDQILAVAFLQRLIRGSNILANYVEHANSYAYRMNTRPIEMLYKSWWDAYYKYITDARNAASGLASAYIIRTDLSSYFTKIDQNTLVGLLRQFADISNSRSLALVNYLVRRDCGIGTEGLGLPQGHSWSGVLANIYLNPVDKCFEHGLGLGCQYFRYVDDIIIVCKDERHKQLILDALDVELRQLGLQRSEQKTRLYAEKGGFLSETEIDDLLDGLGKNHRRLMARLYKLKRNAGTSFFERPHHFSKLYSNAIANNRVFIAPDRLLRSRCIIVSVI